MRAATFLSEAVRGGVGGEGEGEGGVVVLAWRTIFNPPKNRTLGLNLGIRPGVLIGTCLVWPGSALISRGLAVNPCGGKRQRKKKKRKKKGRKKKHNIKSLFN